MSETNVGANGRMYSLGEVKKRGRKKNGKKNGTSMILCFYWQEPETFKENHKIIDVPLSSRGHDRLHAIP